MQSNNICTNCLVHVRFHKVPTKAKFSVILKHTQNLWKKTIHISKHSYVTIKALFFSHTLYKLELLPGGLHRACVWAEQEHLYPCSSQFLSWYHLEHLSMPGYQTEGGQPNSSQPINKNVLHISWYSDTVPIIINQNKLQGSNKNLNPTIMLSKSTVDN